MAALRSKWEETTGLNTWRIKSSGGFQLSQAKKRKSRGAKKRRTEKFIKKYNIKTVKCQVCGYPSNFKNNKTCRECQAPLEGESITAVYLDTKRAEGRANSDPIQLGLVKYCYSAGAGAGTLISKLQLNIWTDQKIDDWASRNCHKIKKRNGKMSRKLTHRPFIRVWCGVTIESPSTGWRPSYSISEMRLPRQPTRLELTGLCVTQRLSVRSAPAVSCMTDSRTGSCSSSQWRRRKWVSATRQGASLQAVLWCTILAKIINIRQ